MESESLAQIDYRHIAFERLQDAFALYEAGRYSASLYLSGFVIEIGIKAEFQRLGKINFNNIEEQKKTSIYKHLFGNIDLNDASNKLVDKFRFPQTVSEFVEFIQNIVVLEKKNGSKDIKNQIKDFSNEFSTILTTRPKPKQGGDNNGSTFHDTKGFLEALDDWRSVIEEKRFTISDYDISGSLGWGIGLRYGETSDRSTTEEVDAKNGLKMAINFFKEFFEEYSDRISIYENQLNGLSSTIESNTSDIEDEDYSNNLGV